MVFSSFVNEGPTVNLSKVRLNDALRCGESVAFTESQAQSDRASSWLWSVANNPKSSKSGVQDYKAPTYDSSLRLYSLSS